MIDPRFTFIRFKDSTIIQVSEISDISPDKTSQHPLWKLTLKTGREIFLTKSEYDALVDELGNTSTLVEFIDLDDED